MSEIITHSTESGSVAADEDGGSEHDVSSSNINDDLTCDETEKAKESQEDETNPTTSDIVDNDDAESADMVDDEPAAEEQTVALNGRDVIVNANADIEPSDDDAEDNHSDDVDEEPVLINDVIVNPPDKSTEDVATPDRDDDTSDATEDYTNLSSPDVPVDIKEDSVKHVQIEDEKDDSVKSLNEVKSEFGDTAVVDESIHEANTTQPEREHGNLDDDAAISLGSEENAPVENDEEMACLPDNIDDMVEDAYPEDRSPARCYRSYILVACIATISIIAAAVIATSLGRDGVKESVSSSSSSTTTIIAEDGEGTDTASPSTISGSSPETQEPSSIQPTFGPSTEPSSQYQWLQSAIDNYIGMLQSEEIVIPPLTPHSTVGSTLNPSSKPTANATPLPSTANPTTSKPTTSNPTLSTVPPTSRPTIQPTTANPTSNPTSHPSTASPTIKSPIQSLFNVTELSSTAPPVNLPMQPPLNLFEVSFHETNTTQPTPQQRKGCITNSVYDEIDRDIGCLLTNLYASKYSERQISRADFWIACANAVIRQTSVNNGLDLRDTFEWGRVDANSCSGQGNRLPSPRGCSQTEDVFLTRMGLTWTDATALMGAHTIGRGDTGFSGHHGTWVPNNNEAMMFDKTYYEEVFLNSWHPRNIGTPREDWTTGNGVDRVMLNTDLCLVMEIDDNMPCCTGTRCTGLSRRCPRLPDNHPRSEAFEAFREYLGGSYPNDNQVPFYNAYREAWRKATKVGQKNLSPLADNCDVE
eukprot:scaffold4863_cov149-Skeletonema_marinoi.AAC.1